MMDLGGINLALIEVVAVVLLGLALLYAVMRTRSRGKQDNSLADDRETRARYAEEDRLRKANPEVDD